MDVIDLLSASSCFNGMESDEIDRRYYDVFILICLTNDTILLNESSNLDTCLSLTL